MAILSDAGHGVAFLIQRLRAVLGSERRYTLHALTVNTHRRGRVHPADDMASCAAVARLLSSVATASALRSLELGWLAVRTLADWRALQSLVRARWMQYGDHRTHLDVALAVRLADLTDADLDLCGAGVRYAQDDAVVVVRFVSLVYEDHTVWLPFCLRHPRGLSIVWMQQPPTGEDH